MQRDWQARSVVVELTSSCKPELKQRSWHTQQEQSPHGCCPFLQRQTCRESLVWPQLWRVNKRGWALNHMCTWAPCHHCARIRRLLQPCAHTPVPSLGGAQLPQSHSCAWLLQPRTYTPVPPCTVLTCRSHTPAPGWGAVDDYPPPAPDDGFWSRGELHITDGLILRVLRHKTVKVRCFAVH